VKVHAARQRRQKERQDQDALLDRLRREMGGS
jgi:hypothetical protein